MSTSPLQNAPSPTARTIASSLPLGMLLGFLELLAVGALSMLLVDQVTSAVLTWLGALWVFGNPAGIAVIMIVDVCAGTALWMLHRRRTTRSIAVVTVAVATGFALPLPAFWAGAITAATAVWLGHVLVVPMLAFAVLLMPRGLSTGPGRQVAPLQVSAVRSAMERVARRWPTVLALLLTFGEITDPGVTPPWALVVLGSEYLVIGVARRQFKNRRLLMLHIAGAGVYAVLALLATVVDPTLAGILIGVGWIVHALWDGALYRANVVVWRWFAEACVVIDLVVGVTAIAAVTILAG